MGRWNVYLVGREAPIVVVADGYYRPAGGDIYVFTKNVRKDNEDIAVPIGTFPMQNLSGALLASADQTPEYRIK